MDIGPGELLIVLAILLVLFGGKKIPEIARGLGQAQREFRDGLHGDADVAAPTPTPEPSNAVATRDTESEQDEHGTSV